MGWGGGGGYLRVGRLRGLIGGVNRDYQGVDIDRG